MKQCFMLGIIIISVLGDTCYEHVTNDCRYADQNTFYCKCEEGWQGDGCCEQKNDNSSSNAPTVWGALGSAIFIMLIVLCIFRKKIMKKCNPPVQQEQPIYYAVNVPINQQQRDPRPLNSQYQQIQPQFQLFNIAPNQANNPNLGKEQEILKEFKPISETEKQQIITSDCAICLQKLTQDICVTPCRHIFHRLCIEQVLLHQKQCPLDRLDLNQNQLIPIF